MSDILLLHVILISGVYLSLFFLREYLKFRLGKTVLHISLFWLVAMFASSWIVNSFEIDALFLSLPLATLLFLIYHHNVTISAIKALGLYCSSVTLVFMFTCFATIFIDCLKSFFGTESLQMNSELFLILLTTFLIILMLLPYLKYGETVVDQLSHPKFWYATILINVLVVYLMLLLLHIEKSIFPDSHMVLCILFVVLIVLFQRLAIQILGYFIICDLSALFNLKEKNRILELQQNQFIEQQQFIEVSEKTLHDFRQSIRLLFGLYEAGKNEEIGQYLRHYIETMPLSEITVFCHHNPLNALLNYYAHLSEEKQISFIVRVSIPDNLPISDLDLCTMVGNILDNAIYACEKAEDKTIQISIIAENNVQLYIVAVNSFDGNVCQNAEGKYLSVRHQGKSIGLSSISSTAKAYNGIAQFSHKGKRFFSNIAIPL